MNGSHRRRTLVAVIFDAFVNAPVNITVTAAVNGVASPPSFHFGPQHLEGTFNPTTGPSGNVWQSVVGNHPITLQIGQTLTVTWTTSQGERLALDNIAYVFDGLLEPLVGVPEPTNILGLGILLTSVIVMRHRRRSTSPDNQRAALMS